MRVGVKPVTEIFDCSFSRFNFTKDRERGAASAHLSLATNQLFEKTEIQRIYQQIAGVSNSSCESSIYH
jgi:hypothetical protein